MLAVEEESLSLERYISVNSSGGLERWYECSLEEFANCVRPQHRALYDWISDKSGYSIHIGYWYGTSDIYVRFLFDDIKDAEMFAFQARLLE